MLLESNTTACSSLLDLAKEYDIFNQKVDTLAKMHNADNEDVMDMIEEVKEELDIKKAPVDEFDQLARLSNSLNSKIAIYAEANALEIDDALEEIESYKVSKPQRSKRLKRFKGSNIALSIVIPSATYALDLLTVFSL